VSCSSEQPFISMRLVFGQMWESTNKANRIYNLTPKDDPPEVPRNRLYVVESPEDGKYHVTLEVDDQPASLRNRLMYAIYDGSTKLSGGEGSFPASGPANMVFDHPATNTEFKDFDVKVGYDLNGDGTLGVDDALFPLRVVSTVTGLDKGPPVIRGSCMARYAAALESITNVLAGAWTSPGWTTDAQIPNAKSLLRIFMDGNSSGVISPYPPSSSTNMEFNAFYPGYFSEWLTHNAGANFNEEGVATITEYQWEEDTPLSVLVVVAPQIEDALSTYYSQVVYPQATNYFQTQLVWTVAYFPPSTDGFDIPHVSESQPWVPGCTLTFNTWWPDLLDDTNGSIGRGRLLSHKARYRIQKTLNLLGSVELIVTEVQSWGELIDLYDFNHDVGGKSQDAAILQQGFGNGGYGPTRNRGKIFRTRVLFNKTYEELP
jgi:hypothetical protein